MKRLLLAALVGAASAGALHAQTASEAIINRAQQPAPPPPPDAVSPSGSKGEKGDLDGGTQRIAEARKLPFKLTLAYDLQVFYTSNVFLSPGSEVESVVVANTVQARADFNSFAVGEALATPSVGLVYQRYYHGLGTGDQLRQDLDFDAYTLPLALRVRFGEGWEATASVTGTAVYSLEGPPSYNLTYQSISTAAGLRKTIALSRDQIVVLGTGVNFVKTDSDVPVAPFNYRDDRNDKIDVSLDAAYYLLKDKWLFSGYTRLLHSDYRHYQEAGFADVDRRDLTFTVGASATYNINEWASARVFTSADWRDSLGANNTVDYSYKTQNLGVGLSLIASF